MPRSSWSAASSFDTSVIKYEMGVLSAENSVSRLVVAPSGDHTLAANALGPPPPIP